MGMIETIIVPANQAGTALAAASAICVVALIAAVAYGYIATQRGSIDGIGGPIGRSLLKLSGAAAVFSLLLGLQML